MLDRSPSIGVRGELTLDYLAGLGFRDAEVIGCPSLFLHGDRLRIDKPTPTLASDARVAINVSPYVTAMGPIVRHHVERYPRLTYIPQDIDTLELLLWGGIGERCPGVGAAARSTPRIRCSSRTRCASSSIHGRGSTYLREVDFSFGTRIHGNIAALMAGTPAVVLAHDSRTLELARYFDIPHRLIGEVPADVDAADLYAEADFTAFNRRPRRALRHVHGFPVPPRSRARVRARGETDPSFATRLGRDGLPAGGHRCADRRAARGVWPGMPGERVVGARRRLRGAWVRRIRVAVARGRGGRHQPGRLTPGTSAALGVSAAARRRTGGARSGTCGAGSARLPPKRPGASQLAPCPGGCAMRKPFLTRRHARPRGRRLRGAPRAPAPARATNDPRIRRSITWRRPRHGPRPPAAATAA